MAQLSGMKQIAAYINRSEATALDLIRFHDMPAWKPGGIWESDTEAIDKWRLEKLRNKPADPKKKPKSKKRNLKTRSSQ